MEDGVTNLFSRDQDLAYGGGMSPQPGFKLGRHGNIGVAAVRCHRLDLPNCSINALP